MENAEERAYRSIINQILSGAYSPGDFLLELEIAQKLSMSRTPVSRALSRLVSEGFLNKMPKKGCYIPIPTPKDAELVFEARQIAEGEAAAMAARNATEDEVAQLEKLLAKDTAAFENKDKELWESINEGLHLLIAKYSHNPYVEKWVQNAFWRSNVYIFYFDGFYRPPMDVVIEHETPKQHAAIVRAIMEKDQDRARGLMKQHIYTTYSKLLIKR